MALLGAATAMHDNVYFAKFLEGRLDAVQKQLDQTKQVRQDWGWLIIPSVHIHDIDYV